MSQAQAEGAPRDLSATLWWAVPAAAVLLLLGLAIVVGGQAEPLEQGTSYDASNRGFRAAYLLLDELQFPVERSRSASGGAIRLALAPRSNEQEARTTAEWVRAGGLLLLADESAEFARALELKLEITRLKEGDDAGEEAATGLSTARVQAGNVRVTAAEPPERVLCRAGTEPLLSAYRRGSGEVWLVNRPLLLSNGLLGKADNAVILCRLVEAALRVREGPILFDEYVHGLRARPGLIELLGRPPALWMTLQCVVVAAIVLWHHAPRFGALRLPAPQARRSKEEFLDAMATLLSRKGDESDAFCTARNALALDIGRELELPPGTPPETLAYEAARRRPVNRDRLLQLLTASSVPAAEFLVLMNELETIHHEFFDRSRHQ